MAYKYKRIFMPNHPTAMSDGWMKEHRYIAELKLGRLLKPEEVVHHIDENREHNTLDNLIILCPICHKKLTTGKYLLQGREAICLK